MIGLNIMCQDAECYAVNMVYAPDEFELEMDCFYGKVYIKTKCRGCKKTIKVEICGVCMDRVG